MGTLLQRVLRSNPVIPGIPTKVAISWSINQDTARNSIPSSAQVRDCPAACSAFGSPPEVKNLIPLTISIIKRAIKLSPTEREIIRANKSSSSFNPAGGGPI